ncbi:MAG: hypothetical protein R3C01_15215 [Planctomycetaceae bacterium]
MKNHLYYIRDGKQHGPLERWQIARAIRDGTLKPSDVVFDKTRGRKILVSQYKKEQDTRNTRMGCSAIAALALFFAGTWLITNGKELWVRSNQPKIVDDSKTAPSDSSEKPPITESLPVPTHHAQGVEHTLLSWDSETTALIKEKSSELIAILEDYSRCLSQGTGTLQEIERRSRDVRSTLLEYLERHDGSARPDNARSEATDSDSTLLDARTLGSNHSTDFSFQSFDALDERLTSHFNKRTESEAVRRFRELLNSTHVIHERVIPELQIGNAGKWPLLFWLDNSEKREVLRKDQTATIMKLPPGAHIRPSILKVQCGTYSLALPLSGFRSTFKRVAIVFGNNLDSKDSVVVCHHNTKLDYNELMLGERSGDNPKLSILPLQVFLAILEVPTYGQSQDYANWATSNESNVGDTASESVRLYSPGLQDETGIWLDTRKLPTAGPQKKRWNIIRTVLLNDGTSQVIGIDEDLPSNGILVHYHMQPSSILDLSTTHEGVKKFRYPLTIEFAPGTKHPTPSLYPKNGEVNPNAPILFKSPWATSTFRRDVNLYRNEFVLSRSQSVAVAEHEYNGIYQLAERPLDKALRGDRVDRWDYQRYATAKERADRERREEDARQATERRERERRENIPKYAEGDKVGGGTFGLASIVTQDQWGGYVISRSGLIYQIQITVAGDNTPYIVGATYSFHQSDIEGRIQ